MSATATVAGALRGASAVPPDGRLVVMVSDVRLSADGSGEIVTHALGSCIGLTVWDPVARVGGMLHFMLPSSSSSPDRAAASPAMFGDTGVPLLFRSAYALGAVKERLVVAAAGGAEILQDGDSFRVGSKNRTLLRKILWANGVLLSAEDTGGNHSRTMALDLSDGRVEIRSRGEMRTLWPDR